MLNVLLGLFILFAALALILGAASVIMFFMGNDKHFLVYGISIISLILMWIVRFFLMFYGI